MLIIPAIDLQNGACVRLKQGQFDRLTQFEVLPLERASYFATAGAKRLHVVDLDGAQAGAMQQLALIASMQDTGISVQAGGGIRTLEQAQQCIKSGIDRLVIGSIAVSNPVLTAQIIEEAKPENIILAIDVRIEKENPVPAINGWRTASQSNLWELVAYYQQMGVNQVLCTDIACDGMMSGPNFNLYQQAIERFPDVFWQASGGIRDKKDIALLDSIGISAAILGLTLYQGNLDLVECLREYE